MPELPSNLALADGELDTDLGNARRFVAYTRELAEDRLRYVAAWRSWLVWDGTRWQRDETGTVHQQAEAAIRSLYTFAAGVDDKAARTKLVAHARASESHTKLVSMVRRAESAPEVAKRPSDFDRDGWVLNVLNGTLDLRTGALRPHSRDDYITKIVPITYTETAACPRWVQFVTTVTSGCPETAAYLQRIAGYALTGDAGEQCWFFPYGEGANGKTTYVETLRGVLGDYARQTNTATLLAAGLGDKIREDIVRLAGARLVTGTELPEDARWNEALMKRLTGGDTTAEREMWAKTVEFVPTFKLLVSGNHKPAVWDTTHGFWRRVRVIPFQCRIPEPHIRDFHRVLLAEEGPGILRWAVEGCLAWQREKGLGLPTAVDQATRLYQQDQDILGEFVEACLTTAPDEWLELINGVKLRDMDSKSTVFNADAVADAAGVARNTIVSWVDSGLLTASHRLRESIPLFTREELERAVLVARERKELHSEFAYSR